MTICPVSRVTVSRCEVLDAVTVLVVRIPLDARPVLVVET